MYLNLNNFSISTAGVAINVFYNKNISDSNTTFTSLLYGNGPGGIRQIRSLNLTNEETGQNNYTQESAVYMRSETHGGEDVAIYASGPMGHLFEGTVEQSFIPHAMAYAACIGPNYRNNKNCFKQRGINISSSSFSWFIDAQKNLYFFLISFMVSFI